MKNYEENGTGGDLVMKKKFSGEHIFQAVDII